VDEELHEIMQNSSYEEYVESEEEEDNEKNNVQREEGIDYEIEASAFQRKEDSDDLLLLYVQPIGIFSSKSGLQWWSNPPLVMKGKQVTLLLLIQVSKMIQKSFLQFRKHCNYLSVRKWWEKFGLNQISKRNPFQ
jgi:hypothetical protein